MSCDPHPIDYKFCLRIRRDGGKETMLRRLLAFLVFGISATSITAAAVAQEDSETSPSDQPPAEVQAPEGAPPAAPPPGKVRLTPPIPEATTAVEVKPEVKPEAKSEGAFGGWTLETHGYFRAPLAIGISSRPNPGQYDRPDTLANSTLPQIENEKKRCTPSSSYCLPDGEKHLQLSYAPNRTMDWSYYSFAYTRLQEQDWGEITFHAKKKHVDAAIGFMGYWMAAAGFRNPDAEQVPGIAYLALDTDLDVGAIKPNVALKMGAFWPGYGYFEKYDTFTLGRFRHMGEQLKATLPFSPEFTVTAEQGFGVGRDGKYDYGVAVSAPQYAGMVSTVLIAYGHVSANYLNYAKLGVHYNYEWTRDPDTTQAAGANQSKSFIEASKAYLRVIGAELKLDIPVAGRLWVSPSYISVKNGWALGGLGGTEVMHSQGGMGIATNYMGWTNSPPDSTGSGTMKNIGFTYENSLSNILPGNGLPDVKVSVFGLIARSTLDLPDKTTQSGPYQPPKNINQYKWGADATVIPLEWLAVMGRWDTVSLLNRPGYVFSAITGRLMIFSHYLSSEMIYLQFSHYKYGDEMKLAGQVPWGANPLVAGSDVLQGKTGGYGLKSPDENVVKLQAQVTF
jgi:hypothetical protein